MRRAVPVAAVIAIAAVAAAAEAAPSPSLTAKVSPKPVLLNHTAGVKGQLSSHKSGVGLVLETSRFPFSGGFHQAKTTTTGSNGNYLFQFKPTLATRVRVHLASDPSVQSTTPTAYVIADYSQVKCHIRKSGKNISCANPNAHGDMTIHFSYHLTWPASAYATESAKPVYVYFGQRNGAAKHPDSVRLRKTVNQTKLGNNKTAIDVSYFFHAPNTAWGYQLATCIKFTEAADGVGLPGNHHCGDQDVSYKQAVSYTFG